MKSSDIHIRAVSQEMSQPSITKIRFKITCLKFHSNFPGANEKINTHLKIASDQWRPFWFRPQCVSAGVAYVMHYPVSRKHSLVLAYRCLCESIQCRVCIWARYLPLQPEPSLTATAAVARQLHDRQTQLPRRLGVCGTARHHGTLHHGRGALWRRHVIIIFFYHYD